MKTALIVAIALIVLLAALLLFIRHKYVKLAAYTRKADAERVAMAIELGELRAAAGFLSFR